MDREFKILLLEDSNADVYLLRRHLAKKYPTMEMVDVSTREDFERQLYKMKPDMIFSDYRLPLYSGIEALLYTRANMPTVPFIFVTGAMQNERVAQNTILEGAHGFVLKNNLEKLDTVIADLLGEEGLVA